MPNDQGVSGYGLCFMSCRFRVAMQFGGGIRTEWEKRGRATYLINIYGLSLKNRCFFS